MKALKQNRFIIIILSLLLLLALTACKKEENISIDTAEEVNIAEERNPEEAENDDSGEVKYLLTEMIIEDLRTGTGEKYIFLKRDYDDKGNLLEEIQYDKDGEITAYEKYVYDEEGRVKEFTELRYVFGDYIKITRVYEYDAEGRKTGYIDLTEVGAKCGEGRYEYYDNGNLKYEYSENIYQDRETEIFYRENGEKEKKREYSGLLERTYVSEYEQEYEEGVKVKEIETMQVEETGGKLITTIYYNNFGKTEKYIKENSKEIVVWFERKYDEKGNEIETIIRNNDGSISEIEEYEYDEKGNEIKKITKRYKNKSGEIEIDGVVLKEFDEYGNQIKVQYKNNLESSVYEIIYYKYKKLGGE